MMHGTYINTYPYRYGHYYLPPVLYHQKHEVPLKLPDIVVVVDDDDDDVLLKKKKWVLMMVVVLSLYN